MSLHYISLACVGLGYTARENWPLPFGILGVLLVASKYPPFTPCYLLFAYDLLPRPAATSDVSSMVLLRAVNILHLFNLAIGLASNDTFG